MSALSPAVPISGRTQLSTRQLIDHTETVVASSDAGLLSSSPGTRVAVPSPSVGKQLNRGPRNLESTLHLTERQRQSE
jgi:hypothetical protein